MNKEKQIEKKATCNNCVHEKVCVIRAFPSAFENTHWEKEPCDHFVAGSDGECATDRNVGGTDGEG